MKAQETKMKYLIAPAAALLTTPVLAHEGAHLHPHASDPAWAPIVVGTVALACLARLIWVRR
ncbi:hypothetical protein [Shimia aestuarii]|nr:hypothetical protein [Shimia aestuarii]